MTTKKRTQKVSMTYGFVLRAAKLLAEDVGIKIETPAELAKFSQTTKGLSVFPEGLTIEQARHIFANPDKLVQR